jgi:hypothetical protein
MLHECAIQGQAIQATKIEARSRRREVRFVENLRREREVWSVKQEVGRAFLQLYGSDSPSILQVAGRPIKLPVSKNG